MKSVKKKWFLTFFKIAILLHKFLSNLWLVWKTFQVCRKRNFRPFFLDSFPLRQFKKKDFYKGVQRVFTNRDSFYFRDHYHCHIDLSMLKSFWRTFNELGEIGKKSDFRYFSKFLFFFDLDIRNVSSFTDICRKRNFRPFVSIVCH